MWDLENVVVNSAYDVTRNHSNHFDTMELYWVFRARMPVEFYDYFLIEIVKMYLSKHSFIVEVPHIIPKTLVRPINADNYWFIANRNYQSEDLESYIINAATVQWAKTNNIYFGLKNGSVLLSGIIQGGVSKN